MTSNDISHKLRSIRLLGCCNRSVGRIVLICLVSFLGITLTSCHSSKKISSTPGHPEIVELHLGRASKIQKKIVEEAYTWLGTPYKYAGEEKGKGADCSGMVMMVYKEATGEKIPRNSAKQAEYCIRIDASDVSTGDLVFFATGKDPKRVSHVGIVLDDENFIHASSSRGVVVTKFTNTYFQKKFIMYGRVPRNRDLVSDTNSKDN